MPWVLAIKEIATGKIRTLSPEDRIAPDDTRYGDVHVAPVYEDGSMLSFGAHEFTRQCYCHPEVRISLDQRPIVVHRERKPN